MTREEWENEMVEITDQQHVLRHTTDIIRGPEVDVDMPVSGSAGETIKQHLNYAPLNRHRTIWCARKDHPDYETMTYKKQPLPGEWWELEGEGRVYVSGYDNEGDPVYVRGGGARADMMCMSQFLDGGTHLPECTGWNWEPPQPAQEDPEEWVVQDRVPARAEIDFGWWDNCIVKPTTYRGWGVCKQSEAFGQRHGWKASSNRILNVFCRRKDLPPLEQEQETLVLHECIVRFGDNNRLSIIQTTDINDAKRYYSFVVPTGNTITRSIPKGTL